MRLLFVADGERDRIMMPLLVNRILNTTVTPEFAAWARLDTKRGYRAKVRFAILSSQNRGMQGLVATVDSDNDPKRINELRAGRDDHRNKKPSYPTALGCAFPHAEAWLVDDPVAVRTALKLQPNHSVAVVTKCGDPKQELDRLHRESVRHAGRPLDLIADIARMFEPTRCHHGGDTGFESFRNDVLEELGPLSTGLMVD